MNNKYRLLLLNLLYETVVANDRAFQLGLLYISTYVRQHGFETKILVGEYISDKIQQAIQAPGSETLVGFYVTADNAFEVERECRTIKENNPPSVKIILGGPQARVSYRTFLEHKICDYVCIGDGEETTVELLKLLSGDEDININDIINLAYITNEEQVYVTNTKYKTLDLDHFPIPDRMMFPEKFRNTSHICSSRGCVSKCTFCYEGTINKLKRHSIDRIVEEVHYLRQNFATRYFTFVDDTFTSDIKKVHNLCERFETEFQPFRNFTWYCECKPSDLCRDTNLAQSMVNGGLLRAQIGSESGVQAVLDAYKKDMLVEHTTKSVEMLTSAGIVSIFTNFIVGGALETEDTFATTCKFMCDLMDLAPGILECSHTFLSPYTGTDIRLSPEKYGLELLDTAFLTASSDSYLFAKPNDISKERVLEMGAFFQSLIAEKMSEIYSNLPIETIRRQLYFNKFGISTSWMNYIRSDPIMRTWHDHIINGNTPVLSETKEDQYSTIPIRTFQLTQIRSGSLNWDRRNLRINLNGFEHRAVELCSGKINLSTICNILKHEFPDCTESKIIDFLRVLANHNLIVFRTYDFMRVKPDTDRRVELEI